jgi:hypothetical protein
MAGTGAALPSDTPFIVTGAPILLRAITEVSSQVPNLTIVSVSGPPEAPERLVVRMSETRARQFTRAFADAIHIEPDLPLPDVPDGGLGPV